MFFLKLILKLSVIAGSVIFVFSKCFAAEVEAGTGTMDEALDYESNMYSKLRFEATDSEPAVEFHSYELVRIAQNILSQMQPLEPTDTTPHYATYSDHVEEEFANFTQALLERAAKQYAVDATTLKEMIHGIYTGGGAAALRLVLNPKYSAIMKKITAEKETVGPLITEDYRDRILPVQLKAASTIKDLMSLTVYLGKSVEPIEGWWINIGGRLVRVKHLSGHNSTDLYVSDHGFIDDIKKDTVKALLDSETQEGVRRGAYALTFWNFWKTKEETKKNLLRRRFVLMQMDKVGEGRLSDEYLLYALSLPIAGQIAIFSCGGEDNGWFRSIGDGGGLIELSESEKEKLATAQPEAPQEFEGVFENVLEYIRFRGEVQTTIFGEWLVSGSSGGLSPFFTQIDNIFHPEDAKLYRVFFTLKEVAKKSSLGTQEYLFRPKYSFGQRIDGESYRGFAEAVSGCFSNYPTLTEMYMAGAMRDILKGKVLTDGSLHFLPNLVVAWFYSETARNSISLLSGLMLLDFIESGVTHVDGDGNNLYTWKHTLVHPRKPNDGRTYKMIKDLYGDVIELGQFDGMHPMAHGKGMRKDGGSVKDARAKLQTKGKLTTVRQKEGHLMIHWLHEAFQKEQMDVVTTVVPVSSSAPLAMPDYKGIDNLLDAASEPSKSMKSNSISLRRWNILQLIKTYFQQRLSSFDFLL